MKATNKRKPSVTETDTAYMYKRRLIRFMRRLRLTSKAPRRPRVK